MKITEISCLCGAVRLRLTGEPSVQFYCHCDDGQAVHGAAYVGVAMYPADAVQVTQGELETWTHKTRPRRRCAACGTWALAEVPELGTRGVKANFLPKGAFTPEFHQQCRYAMLPVTDDLPHYKSLPARFGGSDETVEW
ncbi:MAG: GFA family protein [Gammaproteobacteria bacterium]